MAKTDKREIERWRQHVESHKKSGLTRKAYCREHRLNIHTLDYWRKRLKQGPADSNSQNQNDFIPIQIKEEPLSDCIKLKIGQIAIEVPSGFDPVHLKNILRVLGAAC